MRNWKVSRTGRQEFLPGTHGIQLQPRQFQEAADHAFGKDTYYAKVDTSLPERAKRQWERRPEDNGGEG